MGEKVDVMLVQGQLSQFTYLKSQVEEVGGSCWLGTYYDAHSSLIFEEIKPRIAIIHLSSEIVGHTSLSGKEWIGGVLAILPKQARRVLVTGGINYPQEGKAVAILLGADMIFAEEELKYNIELIKKLVGKGEADPNEIEQRYSSVEIEGKRVGPENEILPVRGIEGYDFRDDYHKRKKE